MSLSTFTPTLSSVAALAKEKKTKIYVVGGLVRDAFLDRPSLDVDFALPKGAIAFAKAFSRRIKGAFVLLDEEHACARVVKREQGKLLTFDFADFRHRTLAGDLAHRDFTINALAVELNTFLARSDHKEGVLDQLSGLRDLRQGVIRQTSPKAFRDDPLRLLRAFSLQAQLNFKIERSTLARIKKDVKLIRDVSMERVREELFKILASPRAAENLRLMDNVGLLAQIIPQITIMIDCHQGGYHHLDVWPHSLETVAQLEGVLKETQENADIAAYVQEPIAGEHRRYALMKLAALLHDIGKPETKKEEKDRMSFHGHEHVGRRITRHVAQHLKLATDERHLIEDMVLWHLRPGYLSNYKKPSDRMVFRYFRDTKKEAVSILLFSLADQRSTRGPLTSEADQRHHEKICLGLVDHYFAKQKEQPLPRLITGHDLIKKLKLKPSPLFAKILKKVEEHQALGKVTTKDEALKLAKQMV